MDLTTNDLEQIESYFNQTLSEKDNHAFEKRLQDVTFRRAVYEYQATTALLNTIRERERKAFLKEIDATMPPFEVPVRRLNTTWWAMAATGLVLLSIGIWLLKNTDTNGVKLKSISAQEFDIYPVVGITRGEDVTIKDQALQAYSEKKFKKAIPLLQKAFDLEKDSFLLFYQGIAAIGNGQCKEATPLLEQLQSATFISRQSVNWYLALAAIETGDKEKALFLLKNVENTEGGYQTKVKALLAKLKEN
jgi:tetratricopeptide (TPR) repeat protein